MYKGKSVAVVVPAYNEESQIGKVIETLPGFVDKIVIVDDASTDKTAEVVERYCKKYPRKYGSRIVLIRHEQNQGVGGAITTGYKWARDNRMDVSVVMAGDGQMDPEDLPNLLDPVVEDKADYTKGNRLFTGNAWNLIPKVRYLGNSVLSLLTKIASGYWHVADSQTGYTAASLKVLETIQLENIYNGYGMPNDILVRLNVYNFRVKDVPIKPVYNVGEKSGIKLYRVIFTIPFLLLRLFLWRMKEKYVIRDFHPLVFFYFIGLITFPVGFLLGLYDFFYRIFVGPVAPTSAMFDAFLVIMGLQFLLFAMWFDMEYNRDLK